MLLNNKNILKISKFASIAQSTSMLEILHTSFVKNSKFRGLFIELLLYFSKLSVILNKSWFPKEKYQSKAFKRKELKLVLKF